MKTYFSQREETFFFFNVFSQSTKREKNIFSWWSFNKGNKKDHFSKFFIFG